MAIAGLSIRLYLDNNVDPRLVLDLRRRGFDVIHARDVGNRTASDDEHLAWASAEGRVLFTYDVKDFPRLGRRWAQEGRQHAGILLSVAPPLISYRELLRRLLAFLDATTGEEMVNQVRWI